MTTLTDKELIKEIKERIGSLDVRDNIERRAYEIALASLEAEPVAKIIAHYPLGIDVGKQKFVQAIGELPDFGGHLFAAPPVPVVPEEKPMPNPLSMYAVDAVAAIAEVRGWNACRAAMLQSGNFRENKNSSTNNFREIAETSTNYPVIPSEVLSAILKVAKIRADFDDFDGDRRGIGDCLDEAEQELIVTINKYASQLAAEPIAPNDVREQTAIPQVPVTPDGWISCSERMPDT
ncbi:Eaa protein, partial [Escherichia coli]